MKKTITFTLMLLVLFVMTACSKSTVSETDASTTASETTQAEESTTTAEMKEYIDGKKLVVFGDSITALGTWGSTVAADLNMYFYNGAKGGITSDQGLDRFDTYVRKQNPDFVTILFGQNDLLMEALDEPKVSIEKFKENLTTMVGWVREINAVPILMTNLFVNSDIFFSAQGQDKNNYVNVGTPLEWLDQYNEAVREVAKELDCYLVDNRASVADKYGNSCLSDGIHLNAKGNAKFVKNIEAFFNEHYANDPDAKKVSAADLWVYVNDENKSQSLISFDPDLWVYDDSVMKVALSESNKIQIWNTNGLWPVAEYDPVNQVAVPYETGYIKFDIEVSNVNTSILIYIDGATESAYTSGKQFKLNTLMGCEVDLIEDITGNQHLVGTIKLSDLAVAKTCLHSGNVVISGFAIYAAGSANQKITINEFSLNID